MADNQAYLQSLLSKHSQSLPSIQAIMLQKQGQYSQRIEEGHYDIRRASYSLAYTTLDKSSLRNYRTNHEQLSSQLLSISRALKQGEKCGMKLSDEERKKFVRQMSLDQKMHDKIREEKRKAQEQRNREIEQARKQAQQNEARIKAQNKRRELQMRLEQQQEEKQKRRQEILERNRQYKQVASQKLLMHRMIQSYNKNQNITLQQKKKKLAAIREMHKPISKEDFNQHLERIKYNKELYQQEKGPQSSRSISQSNVDFYKSKWYKGILKEEKVDEAKLAQEEKKMLLELKDRQKKYAQYIKHNFVPESDDKLVEEIAKRQPQPIKRKKPKEIRQMGLNNLQFSKEKIISKEELEEKLKQKLKTTQKIQPPKNYLEELKSQRRSSSINDKVFERASKDRNEAEKVKAYASTLEQRAKKQEELRKLGKPVSQEELDDLYIKAIDTKLKMLNATKK